MVRIAVFGIYPGGRRHLVETSVGILAPTDHMVSVVSPFDISEERLSITGFDREHARSILENVSLETDLKALAADLIVEMPYSYPRICKKDTILEFLTTPVEDKAIGKEFLVFFEDEKIKKYDAVIYIDLDSGCLSGCSETFGLSDKDIDDWKMFEKYRLRALCRRSNVLYSAFTASETLDKDIAKRIDIIIGSK